MEVFLTLSFAAGVICRSYYAVKSGKVPYEMIPFGECQTEPGWKHREQQDRISECPPSLLRNALGLEHSHSMGVEHKVQLRICWKVQQIWRAHKFSLCTLT